MTQVSLRARRWVFIDSSAYYALADANDKNYRTAESLLQTLTAEKRRLYTTNFALAETYALLLSRLSRDDAVRIFDAYRRSAATTIIRVRQSDEDAGWKIIVQYADKEFSLVDAMSFVIMERIGVSEAFTFDDHFRQYGRFRMLP